MQLKFDFRGKNKVLNLSNINIFYGFNNSGKSYLSKIFNDGFNQKNRYLFIVNGSQVLKNDYEVIYIDSSNSLEEQLKLGIKSYLRRTYLSDIERIVNENDQLEDYIYNKFSNSDESINQLLYSFNHNNSITMNFKMSLQSIDDFIINNLNISFSDEHLSTSDNRLLLYKTILEYIKSNSLKKIIIIDDFDLYFDEKNTNNFLNLLSDYPEHYFILFTNKPSSLQFSLGKYNVFNIRRNNIYDLTNIRKMITHSLINEDSSKHYSLEEYLIENKIIVLDNEYETILSQIINNSCINLGRMLVNEYYSLITNCDNIVKIIPTSNVEKNLLLCIDSLFNDKLFNNN